MNRDTYTTITVLRACSRDGVSTISLDGFRLEASLLTVCFPFFSIKKDAPMRNQHLIFVVSTVLMHFSPNALLVSHNFKWAIMNTKTG